MIVVAGDAAMLRWLTVFCLGCLVAGCSEYGADDPFDASDSQRLVEWTTKHHSKRESKIDYVNGMLSITYLDDLGSNRIFNVADSAFKFLKAYKSAAKNPSSLKRFSLTQTATMLDQYNNPVGPKALIRLDFDMSEALKYNFENTSLFDMPNVGKFAVLHPAARNAITKYCEDTKLDAIRRFCRSY